MSLTIDIPYQPLNGIKIMVNDYLPDNTIMVNKAMYEKIKSACEPKEEEG